jgi:serine/threonine protein kinase
VGIVLGACAGLAYAHEKRGLDGAPLGIVHRDVSPQNIIVTFTGDVKLIDFGIAVSDARTDEDVTKSGKLKGKVPYMSPEQCRGEALDARSDLFSLGTLLFELTTGKRLFKGQSELETLKLICDRNYPRPSEVKPGYPPGLERIVLRALSKDRATRYASGREMQGDLEAFVREQRLAVSRLTLEAFMRKLFAEQLAREEQALQAGKKLADVIEITIPETSSSLDLSAIQRISRITRPAAVAAPKTAPTSPIVLILAVAVALAAAVVALAAR